METQSSAIGAGRSPLRAGAMTVAMRAASDAQGPEALRVAHVERGRVLDERLHRDALRADELLSSATGLAPGARIFTREKDGWVLDLPTGARARVAFENGVRMLEGPLRVPLLRSARGKITFGEVTLLFQLVAAPPPRVSPQLPIGTLAAAQGVDWRFAIVAAFSFLAHFGFAGAVQADWMDPVVDENADTAALIAQAHSRPQVPIEQVQTPAEPEKTEPQKTEPKEAGKSESPKSPSHATKSPGVSTKSPKSNSNNLSHLMKDLDDLNLAPIGSHVPGGPATSSILKNDPTAVDAALDDVAKKKDGVSTEGPKLKDPGGNAAPIPGEGPKQPWLISDAKSNPKKTEPGPSGEPVAPKANEPAPQPPIGAAPSDVNAVIAKNRWRLKACYAKELGKNADAEGTIKVRVEAEASGTVLGASTVSSPFSQPTNACVEAAFRAMKFGEQPNATTFTVPVIFTKAK